MNKAVKTRLLKQTDADANAKRRWKSLERLEIAFGLFVTMDILLRYAPVSAYNFLINLGSWAVMIVLLGHIFRDRDERMYRPLIARRWRLMIDAGFVLFVLGIIFDALAYPNYPSTLSYAGVIIMMAGLISFFVARTRLTQKQAQYE